MSTSRGRFFVAARHRKSGRKWHFAAALPKRFGMTMIRSDGGLRRVVSSDHRCADRRAEVEARAKRRQ